MNDDQAEVQEIDWKQASWDGARREQLRRWAELPLENIIAALEEMADLHTLLHPPGKPPSVVPDR